MIGLNTTINGANLITLSGGNATSLFAVSSSVTLTLQNIILSNAFGSGDGGAIVNNGTLVVTNSTIQNSQAAAGFSGGAIVSTGPVTISGSTLANNSATNGGALYPRFAGAVVTITNSVLHDNHATGTDYNTGGWGGAILVWDGATVNLVGSDLYNNTAEEGGALNSRQANSSIMLQGTQAHDNHVLEYGGGIYALGTLTVANSTISGNVSGGGGGLWTLGTVTLTDSTVSGNMIDGFGGGLSGQGTTTLSRVTITGNTATQDGGGVENNSGTMHLTDVTISNNTSTAEGGGIVNFGQTDLTNVTLSGNSAPLGGSAIVQRSGTAVTLKNTIIAKGSRGGNCLVPAGNFQPIISNGFNLSDDTSCAGYFNQSGDQNNVPAGLGALANNGGPTQTHLPQPGSLAIDHGTTAGCPATDQRGLPRPVGLSCDVGAVEVQLPPTATPTRTPPPPTATPYPRPNVAVQVAPSAGTLQTTIAARDAGCAGGNNQLQSVQVTRLTNATVDVATAPVTTVSSARTTVSLPAHPATIGLTVHRLTPGQAATVELIVTDGCGAWPTFVGGGPTAF
ncbi:MAG TPA: choice-of-anchor Q domain-containing protein [Chloroflexota bacterium]